MHLQQLAAALARLNVALGLAQRWLRGLPRTGHTRGLQRNEAIQFVAVQMLIEWPCQNQLLLLKRFRRAKSFSGAYDAAGSCVLEAPSCRLRQRTSLKITASTPLGVSSIPGKGAIALAVIPWR